MKLYSLLLVCILLSNTAIAQYPSETVWNPEVPTSLAEPGYLQIVNDNVNNIDIMRISDSNAFGYPNGTGELRPGYSKTQSWNADMTKLIVGFTNILDASDYSIYKTISAAYPTGSYNDGRWSNVDPDIRYFCYNDNFLRVNIETDHVDTLENFPGYDTRIGPFEGNISADDKYVVISDEAGTKATLYDIELDMKISSIDFMGGSFDWATITPWNNYIVISNNTTGHTELYDLNFNYLRDLRDSQEHADFAIDAFGNEVFVQVIPLSMVRLDNGQITDLISDAEVCGNFHYNPNIAGHISGRNFNLPGWALVSTSIHECSNLLGYNYITEIFAIKLDGSGTIRRYGHSRSSWTSYGSETKASFSLDGTKVIFSSDWNLDGNGNNHVLTYIASVENLLLPVEFIDFEIQGRPSDDKVILSWTTSNEVNNRGFDIQSSTNGSQWNTLGFVNGKGNSNETNKYNFVDKNPANGLNYYRIKQLDIDGAFEYSKVISIQFDRTNQIFVYPNPSNGLFKINGVKYIQDIKITDATGKVLNTNINANNSLDLSSQVPGVYFIWIQTETGIVTKRVVKY